MTGLAPVAGTVAALTFLVGPSTATGITAAPTVPVSDTRALILLGEAARAVRTTPYEGVQFVSRWSPDGTTSLLVDVRHLPGDGTVMRVHGTSAGAGGEVFAPMAEAALPSGLSAAGGGPVALLARNYTVVMAGTGSVAGRPARVVESRRGDNSVSGRFWLDDRTGLILRREVFDSRGATVRASAFIDVTVGEREFASHLPPMLPDPWRTRVPVDELDELRAAGWGCPEGLPRLNLYDVRTTQDDGGQVLHASYSDGLSSVSLFEQRGRLDAAKLAGYHAEQRGDSTVYVRDGVQQSVVWSAGGTVYTVLADAPRETVEAVVASLPHEAVRSGLAPRLERGLERVASWVNPFG